MNTNEQKTRYHLLDGIRGLALLSMILYHLSWDIEYVLGMRLAWYHGTAAYVWQQMTCWTFIFLSGFCWPLGSRPLKRGSMVLMGAMAVSLVTWFMMPAQAAFFGILTFLASAMLLLIPLEKLLRHCWPGWGLGLSALLFLLCRNVNRGYLGFERWNLRPLPTVLYQNRFTTFLGFTEKGFYSVDYFSLLPWLFLYLAGYFWYRYLKEHDRLPAALSQKVPVFSVMGKHSLLIYLLHQPVLYGLLLLFQQAHFLFSGIT